GRPGTRSPPPQRGGSVPAVRRGAGVRATGVCVAPPVGTCEVLESRPRGRRSESAGPGVPGAARRGLRRPRPAPVDLRERQVLVLSPRRDYVGSQSSATNHGARSAATAVRLLWRALADE